MFSNATVIYGYTGPNYQIINQILLIAKQYIYRNKFYRPNVHLNHLINTIKQHFRLEYLQAEANMKQERFLRKWDLFLEEFSEVLR